MKISPFIFLLVKQGHFILWDYKLHNQFEITKEHLDELSYFGTKKFPLNQQIFSELVEHHIIVKEEDLNYSDSDWCWDDLAKIFHIGTQDVNTNIQSPAEYSSEYLEDCEKKFSEASILNYGRAGEKIKLPTVQSLEMENAKLLETLYSRHTSRSFNGMPIPLEKITTLLEVTFATSNRDEECYRSLGLAIVGQRKTSPSGGGLHPSEAYLLVKNVNGLKQGIYHFNSKGCYLTRIEEINNELNIGDILNGQYFANDLSAGIFITSVFKKQWWKYKHSRAYRIALLDVGHLSQTLLLCATGLGLSTWMSGAFNDTKVIQLLKIDKIFERPIFFIGLGYGSGSSVDSETVKILKKEYD